VPVPKALPIPVGMLSVGYITKAQGLKGEVLVHLTTNRPERVSAGTVLHTGQGPLTVLWSTVHGDRWRVLFNGSSDRNSAESLRSLELFAEPIDDPSALWVHELVGSVVQLADGTVVGRVEVVEANPASDLLVLDTKHLIPLAFVVSSVQSVITIDPPAGLLDLLD
jgi:16S rRNA processing protein RimM